MASSSKQYQHFLSNPIAKPPCRMTNAKMYGFFTQVDEIKVQQFIDSTLNIAAPPHTRFEGVGEYGLITFTDIEKIASMTAPYDQHGWMQETDIIIWLPVAKVIEQGGGEGVTHLYWYPAFICVNNIYALINGRETWGYNKYMCDYTMPISPSHELSFSISMDCFKHFSPDSKLQQYELFNIASGENDDDSLFSMLENFGEDIANLFAQKHLTIDLSLLKQLLSGFVNPQMDQILFKQFPDGKGDKAVYQAVLHSPSEIKKVHSFKLLKPDFNLTLNQLDSFPLAEMFGLKIGKQPLYLPFYIEMDFDQLEANHL